MTSTTAETAEKPTPDAEAAADAASAPVEPFGRYLMHQRELRGMSLEQIADQTRVLTCNLRALEQDDYSGLPARVFLLGWIRAYAQAIGLNPDEAVLRYDEQTQKVAPPETEEVARRRPQRRVLIAFVAVAIAGAVGIAAWLLLHHG